MKFRFGRVALAFGSVAAALLLSEAALRVVPDSFFPSERLPPFEWILFDPVVSWRNLPGRWIRELPSDEGPVEVELRVNSLGFRGPEALPNKPEGAIRIACLGDSGTFGVRRVSPEQLRWVPLENYPEILAARLERENLKHVEVLNAGVIGYSSSHGLRQLAVQILDLDVDIVTIRFAANDVNPSWAPALRAIEPSNRALRWLLYEFSGWMLTRLFLDSYHRIDRFHPEPKSVPWTSEDRFLRNLRRMVEMASARGIRVLFVDYPLHQLDPVHEAASTRKMIRDVEHFQALLHDSSRQQGVPLLDTRTFFARRSGRLFDAPDRVHPNARGMKLIADLMFEKLVALGWIDPAAAD